MSTMTGTLCCKPLPETKQQESSGGKRDLSSKHGGSAWWPGQVTGVTCRTRRALPSWSSQSGRQAHQTVAKPRDGLVIQRKSKQNIAPEWGASEKCRGQKRTCGKAAQQGGCGHEGPENKGLPLPEPGSQGEHTRPLEPCWQFWTLTHGI